MERRAYPLPRRAGARRLRGCARSGVPVVDERARDRLRAPMPASPASPSCPPITPLPISPSSSCRMRFARRRTSDAATRITSGRSSPASRPARRRSSSTSWRRRICSFHERRSGESPTHRRPTGVPRRAAKGAGPGPTSRSSTAGARSSARASTRPWRKAASSRRAGMDEFGPVAAAMLIEEVSRLPAIVELGASSLVRPLGLPGMATTARRHRWRHRKSGPLPVRSPHPCCS